MLSKISGASSEDFIEQQNIDGSKLSPGNLLPTRLQISRNLTSSEVRKRKRMRTLKLYPEV